MDELKNIELNLKQDITQLRFDLDLQDDFRPLPWELPKEEKVKNFNFP